MTFRGLRRLAVPLAVVGCCTGVAAAHGGGLGGGRAEPIAVPTWLFLLTGGAVVGASFLLTSFLTDRSLLAALHEARIRVPLPVGPLFDAGKLLGVAGLVVVLAASALGPAVGQSNAAILLVWVGWWAGYGATIYLVGDSWVAVNPIRTIAEPLAGERLNYPDALGQWPAVAGLLAIVWLEVVSPIGGRPRLLAAAVIGYLAIAVAGSALFGTAAWFGRVDPITCVFRQYGHLAPVQRTPEGLVVTLPGSALVGSPAADDSEVALVVALVWATTYDGFVRTPLWADVAPAAVDAGVPAVALYPAVLIAGFLGFLAVFRLAARGVRAAAPTYLAAPAIARCFAPPLLAIAAGYHLAHYLGYFLRLSPALFGSLLDPLGRAPDVALVLPGWFDALPVAFVLVGHLLAVWIAHGVAFDRFPSRLQAVRSQLPITVVMVLYTMVSLWIVTQPVGSPPQL